MNAFKAAHEFFVLAPLLPDSVLETLRKAAAIHPKRKEHSEKSKQYLEEMHQKHPIEWDEVQPNPFAKFLAGRTFDTYETHRYPREENPLKHALKEEDKRAIAEILKYFFPKEFVLKLRDEPYDGSRLDSLNAKESLKCLNEKGVSREQIILFQGLFALWEQDQKNFILEPRTTETTAAIKASIEYHLSPFLAENDLQQLRDLELIHGSHLAVEKSAESQ